MARRRDRKVPAELGVAAGGIPPVLGSIAARDWIAGIGARYRMLEGEAGYVLERRWNAVRTLLVAIRGGREAAKRRIR